MTRESRQPGAPAYRVLSDSELAQRVYTDADALAAVLEALVMLNRGGRPQVIYSDEGGYRVEDTTISVVN
jgi:hypothetical protein